MDSTLIPTPAQRAQDAFSVGGDNATATATANAAKVTADSASNRANDAYDNSNLAISNSQAAISAAGSTQVEAAENMPEFVPITADGYQADCTNSAHFGHVAGITTSAVLAGFMVTIRIAGVITNPTWNWNPLDSIFVSQNGLISTPPVSGWIQKVGIASSPTTMLISIGEPVLL